MTNTYEKDQKDQKEKLNSNIVSAINNFFSRSALEKKKLCKKLNPDPLKLDRPGFSLFIGNVI